MPDVDTFCLSCAPEVCIEYRYQQQKAFAYRNSKFVRAYTFTQQITINDLLQIIRFTKAGY